MRQTACSPFAFMQATATKVAAPAAAPGVLPPGTKTGRWRIEGAPRRFRDGAIYPVIDEQTKQRADLEVIHAPALAFGSYEERIRAVTDSLAWIDHPGIIEVFDIGTLANGRPYLVLEPLDGVTLGQRTGEGPLPYEVALGILIELCGPLAAAHKVGVVHGELELDHVLFRSEAEPGRPQVKLLDWGIARAIADEARKAGMAATAGSSATEGDARVEISPDADVFALGVMAYQLLVAPRLPSSMRRRTGLAPGDGLAAATGPESVPCALDELLIAMLGDDRSARPTIAEVAERLEALRAATSHDEVPDTSEEPSTTTPAESPEPQAIPLFEIPAPERCLVDVASEAPSASHARRSPRRRYLAGLTAATCAGLAIVLAGGAGAPQSAHAPAATDPAATERVATREPAPAIAPARPPAVTTARPTRPAGRAGEKAGGASTTIAAPRPETSTARPTAPASRATRSPSRPTEPAAPVRRRTVRRPAPAHAAKAARPARPARAVTKEPQSLEAALLTQYQRVGHELHALQQQRGPEITAELRARFGAIKIQQALATPESRLEASAMLTAIHDAVERVRGVHPTKDCLDNPLGEGCK